MCGIAGAVDLEGERRFALPRLTAMLAAVAHRGPDGEHVHDEPGLALGARRLAIVDRAHGRQPMTDPRGELWVAHNGELFDDDEVRPALLARGHHLRTRCDTESWLARYRDDGAEAFARARGQFAVALWDRPRRTLWLARDRVGICPLYVAERDGWLLFASEIKALLASGLVEARVDLRGIDHVLSFFAGGTTRTCFDGVSSLAPGCLLEARRGAAPRRRRYWDLDFPDAGDERRGDPDALADELGAALGRAVGRRLRGEVPVVTYLSGGLDSTTIAAEAARRAGAALPAYTVGLDRAGPDERGAARAAADHVGAPLTVVALDAAAIAAAFPALTRAAEGPVIDTADACLLRLAERVRGDGRVVALTGEGADEALAGYPWYRGERLLATLGRATGGLGPRALRGAVAALVGGARRPRGALDTAQRDLYDPLVAARALVYADETWARLGDASPYDDLELPAARFARWAPLHRSLYVDYKVFLPGHLLLGKGDRVAMRSAVETRYPFLDEDLVALCASLAPDYKLRGRVDKWLLRRLAARTLPAPIARRPKAMFKAAPVLGGAARPPWVDELVSPASLARTGIFDPRRVARQRRLLDLQPAWSPHRFIVEATWTGVVATQLWHHLFLGGGLCSL